MKNFILFSLIVIGSLSAEAQSLAKVNITSAGNTESLSVKLDENVVINISATGDLINYGVEYFSERVSNYSRVETYSGRTEMYSAYEDKSFQGKLKYIGRTQVTYYASYDEALLRGKIKSIGNLSFTYYMPYEDEVLRGKIKAIGYTNIGFYTSFDNEALRGKIRTIGATSLSYYTSYDDKAFQGKIKNIGSVSFTYYSSFDRQYAGAMKTGSMQQIVNGVMYHIR
jgi:hypothetical protein